MTHIDCIFCKIAKREAKADIVFEGNNFIVIKDVHPKAEGHVLVIPKKHFVTLLDIPNNLGEEMLETCKKAASILMEKKYGNGFNVLMNNLEPAGQVVKHAHIHIIPRNENDGLKTMTLP